MKIIVAKGNGTVWFERQVSELQDKGYKPKFETFKVCETLYEGERTSNLYMLMVKKDE